MTVSYYIFAVALIFATGVTTILPHQEILALKIDRNESNLLLSHHPRFLLTRALALALTLEDKQDRLKLLGEITWEAIDAEQWKTRLFEDILAEIEAIKFEDYRREKKEKIFGSIAEKFQEIGERDLALEFIDKADPVSKTSFFEESAKFWFEKKDRNRGIEFLMRATESAKEINDLVMGTTYCHNDRSDMLKKFAIDFARLGEMELAFDVVQEIKPCGGLYPGTVDYAPSTALLEVFKYVSNSEEFKKNLAIVEKFATIEDKVKALDSIIPQLSDPDDFQTVLRIVSTLEKTRFESDPVENHGPIALDIVQRWAELGEIENAIALAEKMTHLPSQTSAFLEITRYFSERDGDRTDIWLERTISLAEQITHLPSQTSEFFKIACYFSENEDNRAENWLERTLEMSYHLENPVERVEIFAEIIFLWLKEGKFEKAIEFLQVESQVSLYSKLPPYRLSLYKSIELREVIEILVENERVDLSVQLINMTNDETDPVESKILALIVSADRSIERERTQQAGELLKQTVEELSRHVCKLKSSQILDLSRRILNTEWKLIVHNDIFLETATKPHILDIKHYEFLYSILLTLDESSKWATIQKIAGRLDNAGETDLAFKILESMRLENDYTLDSETVWRLMYFFFKRLENSRPISEEQKHSYLEIALKFIEKNNESFHLIEKIAPLALELEQLDRLFSILPNIEDLSAEQNVVVPLIQNIGNQTDLISVFIAMETFFDSSANTSILEKVIADLKTEEEVELALEMMLSLQDVQQSQILSKAAIRLAEFGKVNRAIELANTIVDVELKALTLARVAAKM